MLNARTCASFCNTRNDRYTGSPPPPEKKMARIIRHEDEKCADMHFFLHRKPAYAAQSITKRNTGMKRMSPCSARIPGDAIPG